MKNHIPKRPDGRVEWHKFKVDEIDDPGVCAEAIGLAENTLSTIRSQIAAAEWRHAVERNALDDDWFRRAHYVAEKVEMMRARLVTLQEQLRAVAAAREQASAASAATAEEIKLQIRDADRMSSDRAFVKAALRVLPHADIRRVIAEMRRMAPEARVEVDA